MHGLMDDPQRAAAELLNSWRVRNEASANPFRNHKKREDA